MSAADIMPEPDPQQMLLHLEHLFDGFLDGCQNGLIELAWTDGKDGRLRHAAIFGTDQLDEIVEKAVTENRKPGQNVYIGIALRKPETPPFGRCTDEDFLALTAFYADLDDEGTAEAAKPRYQEAPPTAVVVTGRHPHLRAQLLWRQETPETNPEICRQQNLAIAAALSGDRTVVNPSRVLRLGGSIAWPTKAGRIIERTEFITFTDSRPSIYLPGQLAKAFPFTKPKSPAADLTVTRDRPIAAATPSHLNIGSEFEGTKVEDCLARIRSGDHWHDNLVRLTGHWISRGWSDEEILTAAEALTLPGWTGADTRREVMAMIAGGRTKWNAPNPGHELAKAEPTGIDLMAWTADRYVGTPKPIEWLCKGTIPLGTPGLLAAMGGTGKSFLALDLALNIAAGIAGFEQQKLLLGGQLAIDGTAVIITAEDSFDAIHRRLDRIDTEKRRLRHPNRLIVVPLPDAGGSMPMVASDGKNLTRTPSFTSLRDQLQQITDLRLVVIDPLQAFVTADVNGDPAAAQFMWTAMAELASTTGATIIVTHHMRKEGGFNIRNGDDAREAIRGTTALVDGARFAYALWKVDKEEAASIGENLSIEANINNVARGALVKSNEAADFSIHTYIRNESGLLEQCANEVNAALQAVEMSFTLIKAREILEEIQQRFEHGTPFSHAPNSGPRYLISFLTRQHSMTRSRAQNLLADWMNNNVVSVDICDRKTKLTGLKVIKWL